MTKSMVGGLRSEAITVGSVVIPALLGLAALGVKYVGPGIIPRAFAISIFGLAVFFLVLARRAVGLGLLAMSYAYCLPIVYYSFLGEHPVRAYDIMGAVLIVAYLADFAVGKRLRIPETSITRPLFFFVGFCLFSAVMTAVRTDWLAFPMSGIRWYRLLIYALGFVFVLSSVKTRRQLDILLNIFLLGALVQGLLSTLQSLGALGPLWDYDRLGMYTPSFYVGTMAPHHLHLRAYLMSALAVLVAKIKSSRQPWQRLGLAACSGLLIYPLFNAHSRTAILMFGVYAAATLLFSRRRGLALAGIGIGALMLFLVFGSEPFEIGQEQVEAQVERVRTKTGPDFTRLSRSRMHIYTENYPRWLREDPAMVVVGKGFEHGFGGAHNCYMHLLVDQGLPGLFIYLWLLFAIWKNASNVAKHSTSLLGRTLASEFLCLFIAILVANLFNEVLYVRRAMYSYLGQFLFVTALVLHPLWLKGESCGGEAAPRKLGHQGPPMRRANG